MFLPKILSVNSRKMQFFINLLASGLFISYIPTAILKNRKFTGAGFLGTALAFFFIPLLPESNISYGIFLTVFTAFSVLICEKAVFSSNSHDDPKIVIDEITGYWTAIAFLPRTPEIAIICFVLFRIFDTVKPFYIKKIDKMKGGLAIVSDDIASGILTNIFVRIGLLLCV